MGHNTGNNRAKCGPIGLAARGKHPGGNQRCRRPKTAGPAPSRKLCRGACRVQSREFCALASHEGVGAQGGV